MNERKRTEPGMVDSVLKPVFNSQGWWGYLVLVLGFLLVLAIIFDAQYRRAFEFILPGVVMTFLLTITSFTISLVFGLSAGLARVSKNRVFYNLATFYVEVIRGVPILVQLLYVAFVIFPALVDLFASAGADISIRDVEMSVRAILGFSIAYGAFEAEVFRAGIESIGRGQMEAARSLGMSYAQAMRYVILPQAFRVVLPPLGNDFVAMLKDTSLASVLAVREITQLSNLHRSRTFTTFEPLNVATFLYLSMTLVLTRGVRYLERRLSPDD